MGRQIKFHARSVLLLAFLLCLAATGFACTCDDDDDDASLHGDDDEMLNDDDDNDTTDDDTSDDDTSDDDTGDDDTTDDDTIDDDTTDDDSVDDDTTDDDSVDDDTTDDDTTDDDTSDDDTGDDDTTDDDTGDDDTTDDDTIDDDDTSDLLFEHIEGYKNIFSGGSSLAIAPDGEQVTIALYLDELYINRGYPDDARTEELVRDDVEDPHLAVDADNHAYISFLEEDMNVLKLLSDTGDGYEVETVDHLALAYSHDIAVRDGVIRIAYFDAATAKLMLATKSGGAWTRQEVDGGAAIVDVSVCIDHNGFVIIAYGKQIDPADETWELFVASNRSGSWVLHDVPTTTGHGRLIDMALDGRGFSHIAHTQNRTVYYTTNLDGVWQTEEVHTVPLYELPTLTTIGVDSLENPRLVFQANMNYDEHNYYCDALAGDWSCFSPADWNLLEHPSLAVDGDDNIHFAAIDSLSIMLVSYIDGVIDKQNLGVHRRAEEDVSLALDTLGRPHVAYLLSYDFEVVPYMLFYGCRIDDAWTMTHIESAGDCAGRPKLTLDAQDHAHIVHLDAAKHLTYTTDASGEWTTETVDASGTIDQTFTQTLDAAGRVHILYRNVTQRIMCVAHQTAGGWSVEKILAGYPGSPDAISFDNAGRLHVVFFSTSRQTVYGRYVGGVWSFEIPLPEVTSLEEQALAVDSAGQPHIVYVDEPLYAYHLFKSGGVWQTEQVFFLGDSIGLSIDIDDNDVIYGAMNYHSTSLVYFTNRSGAWTDVRVNADSTYTRKNALKVHGDTVHVLSDLSFVYYYRFPVWFPGNE
ncbi:MAG TPA: hypothetical protein PKW95_09095 [bacterium]|nr:hypothetical protein [bacterium]